MKLEAPAHRNYAAQIVAVPAVVDLPGLDNLVGVPVLGHQALTTRGIEAGDLRIAFTAETQLSDDYAHQNNLYRHADKNRDQSETGYLEDNTRIKALRLRGHQSNALLMPLESVAYTGVNPSDLVEGTAFDKLGDHEICRKYEIPVKPGSSPARSKIERAFKRVDKKVFPEHLETDNYFRSKHLLRAGREVVVSQKLHGTSWRGGHVPVLRELRWYERALKKMGVFIPEYEWDVVFGSRKVIKDPNNPRQDHFYDNDIWTDYGKQIAELIPEGYLLYGELVGWTPDGTPLQKGYTYHVPVGQAELYVYRVAHINSQGVLSDLSWDGVKEFCTARGLKWTPELVRLPMDDDPDDPNWIDDLWDRIADTRYADGMANAWDDFPGWNEPPLTVSSHKTVDEGICIRQEGLVPTILKAKSPKFLEHETKMLDTGELDTESAA